MFIHYLRVAFRGFRRNKLHSLIGTGCLAIGIATAMTILLYVRKYFGNADPPANTTLDFDCVASGGGLLLIAQLTVLLRTVRAARINPTVNLRIG